jgi:hypothetical protein
LQEIQALKNKLNEIKAERKKMEILHKQELKTRDRKYVGLLVVFLGCIMYAVLDLFIRRFV